MAWFSLWFKPVYSICFHVGKGGSGSCTRTRHAGLVLAGHFESLLNVNPVLLNVNTLSSAPFNNPGHSSPCDLIASDSSGVQCSLQRRQTKAVQHFFTASLSSYVETATSVHGLRDHNHCPKFRVSRFLKRNKLHGTNNLTAPTYGCLSKVSEGCCFSMPGAGAVA